MKREEKKKRRRSKGFFLLVFPLLLFLPFSLFVTGLAPEGPLSRRESHSEKGRERETHKPSERKAIRKGK